VENIEVVAKYAILKQTYIENLCLQVVFTSHYCGY